MERIFVVYPSEFLCQEKFDRKVERILSLMEDPLLLCEKDPNRLISSFAETRATSVDFLPIDELLNSATHAIIFDDGEAFPELAERLNEKALPTRLIKIKITRVVNIRDHPDLESAKDSDSYEYIGRGSYWGNPYSMYEEGESREEVIRKFEYDFENDLFPKKRKADIYRLAGKTLGCFCKPKACHGDVLARFLNSWDDSK